MYLYNLLYSFDASIPINVIEDYNGQVSLKRFENKAAIEETYNTKNWLVKSFSITNKCELLISIW